jgi:hypothetical protein
MDSVFYVQKFYFTIEYNKPIVSHSAFRFVWKNKFGKSYILIILTKILTLKFLQLFENENLI